MTGRGSCKPNFLAGSVNFSYFKNGKRFPHPTPATYTMENQWRMSLSWNNTKHIKNQFALNQLNTKNIYVVVQFEPWFKFYFPLHCF